MDSQPTPFTFKPTVSGERVTLRPATADDVETLADIMRDPEVIKLTGSANASDEPDTLPPLKDLRAVYDTWAEADDRIVWAIIDNHTGDLVGESVLKNWDEGNRSADFRILVGQAGRGRGLGTEATRLTVEHALGPMGLHRVTLEVYAFNDRARHVYEKVGFRHEGVGREALLFDGQWIDVHYMGLLTSDLNPK